MPSPRSFASVTFFALLLAAVGCSSSSTNATSAPVITAPSAPGLTPPVAAPDMYAAGEISEGDFERAAVWKNGTWTVLGPSGQNSVANGVVVSGSDVIVGGVMYDSNFSPQAVLWKDGIAQALTSPPMYGTVQGIAASGSDVYAVGTVSDTHNSYATLWKNGVATTLPTVPLVGPDGKVISYGSTGRSILVQGSDVYIAGNNAVYLKSTDGTQSSGGVAAIWKNGEETLLGDRTYFGDAYAMYLDGTDLYVTGNAILTKASFTNTAVVWKNGNPTRLSDTSSNGNAILVSGNDVSVGGQTGFQTGQPKATLWNNGTPSDLSAGSFRSGVNSLAYLKGAMYAAGVVSTTGATYWLNNVPTTVGPVGSGWNSIIFVTH